MNNIKFNIDIQDKLYNLTKSIWKIEDEITNIKYKNIRLIQHSDVKYAICLIDQNMQKSIVLTKELENMETEKRNLKNQIKFITFEE